MATASKEDVVQRVNHYLGPHQSAEMTIEIVDRLVRTDGDWWYVPGRMVRSSSPGLEIRVFGKASVRLRGQKNSDLLVLPSQSTSDLLRSRHRRQHLLRQGDCDAEP